MESQIVIIGIFYIEKIFHTMMKGLYTEREKNKKNVAGKWLPYFFFFFF